MTRHALVVAAAAALIVAALVNATPAAEPVARTFEAPIDKVWRTTIAVLEHLGWSIDKQDRSIGWITTKSRRLEGEDFGVYAKGTRHRLTLHMKAAGEDRTAVSVERAVFKRERILWMDKDEPVQAADRDVETRILAAIGKSL
jgi:uncharacterized lipoprotein